MIFQGGSTQYLSHSLFTAETLLTRSQSLKMSSTRLKLPQGLHPPPRLVIMKATTPQRQTVAAPCQFALLRLRRETWTNGSTLQVMPLILCSTTPASCFQQSIEITILFASVLDSRNKIASTRTETTLWWCEILCRSYRNEFLECRKLDIF